MSMNFLDKVGNMEVEYYFDDEEINFAVYSLDNNIMVPIIIYTYSSGYLSLYDDLQADFKVATQVVKSNIIFELQKKFNIKINKINCNWKINTIKSYE